MARTLRQKTRDGWIGVAVLFTAGVILTFLEFQVFGGILIVTAIFTGVGVFSTAARGSLVGETADEAAAREQERGSDHDKLAAIERVAADSPDEKARSGAEGDLLWKYMRTWQKSNVLIPNAVVEGWRSRPVDIEDGDFLVLAKERDLKKSMMARDPKKWGKSFSKDIRRTEESVEKWRQGVEEIRAGTRQGPDHFDAADYLRRLNEAFPPAKAKI